MGGNRCPARRAAADVIGPGPGPLYVVVEKILGDSEPLPADWTTHGTSGYDFLSMVNGLFVDPSAESAFTRLYRDWTGAELPFAEVVFEKKYLLLRASFSGEWRTLARQLDRIAQGSRQSRDFTLNSLRLALGQLIACFPVYRSYLADGNIHDDDRRYIDSATRCAILRNRTTSPSLFRFIRGVLLGRDADGLSEEERLARRAFAGRFQQLTAPIMAKGVEDTAFYVYNRLLSLNEVGGNPGRFGLPPEKLHRMAVSRAATISARPVASVHARYQTERRCSRTAQCPVGNAGRVASLSRTLGGAERGAACAHRR